MYQMRPLLARSWFPSLRSCATKSPVGNYLHLFKAQRTRLLAVDIRYQCEYSCLAGGAECRCGREGCIRREM